MVSQAGCKVLFSRWRTIWFVKKSCPHIWALLNERAKRTPPKGIVEFISGKWGSEGRRQLRSANKTIPSLIEKTSATVVGDAYRRDFSGVSTEQQLAEFLCEITLVDAVSRSFSASPILRPL